MKNAFMPLGCIGVIFSLAVSACALVRFEPKPTVSHQGTREIAHCIRTRTCALLINAHRSNGFHAPENSRAAVKRAVATGVHMIEIDLRKSKDGVIFVLHDPTINRTTSESGRIEDALSRDLANVVLENKETIPRFEDIYEITRGRTILDLDFKSNVIAEVAQWIEKNGSFDDVVFYLNNERELESAAHIITKFPRMMIRINAKTPRDIRAAKKTLGRAPDIVTASSLNDELVSFIHREGSLVFFSAYSLERILPSFGWKHVFASIRKKADIIQVDKTSRYFPRRQ